MLDTHLLRVLVVGPAPDSQGGVGVLMGHVSRGQSSRTSLSFLDPGASGSGRFRAFMVAAIRLANPRHGFDLVHFNVASRGSTLRKMLLGSILRLNKTPYVINLHGGSYREFLRGLAPFALGAVSRFFRAAERVIVLGEGWRDFVVQSLGVDCSVVEILPNAVPGPKKVDFHAKEAGYVIFSGRLAKRKGLRDLLAALPLLPNDLQWRLGLAGDSDESISKEELQRSSSDERVSLLGWLSQEQLGRELSRAVMYVLPSHAEGLPLGMLDAMAHGCVPVVTPVGAIPEVVTTGHNGVLVDVGSPSELAFQLEILLRDSHEVRRLGTMARRTWEGHYAAEDYRDRLDSVYANSVQQK